MDAKIFRINYKSDFILTLNSDAGWMTPFCIKFWTGAPSQAYYAYYDGMSYTHCAPVEGEPTKLLVQFDDHHLPIGDLKFQIAYHFTVADFPNDTEDEVINPASITVEIDGEHYQVMLDFTGETAPEIAFSLPAYANEAQRIANEQQRIIAEEQRIANEQTRIAAEATRQQNEEQRIQQESMRVRVFAQLKQESEQATDNANVAALLANEKAQLAADKAALAQSAATLANQKAQLAADKAALADAAAALANQKAQLAADKAALAQQKAEYAQTQGDYAKAQGDYAKQQGEIAEEDHERAEADHTRAESDHATAGSDNTQAGTDHTRAESDHATAAADHTQAGQDHTRVESDHAQATSDHTQAGTDHTRAESDHATASADHTQAGQDHTRAESDHTRAESDHAAVEVYVDSLGAFDISAYHATGGVLAKYADLTAALGTNGANIPEAIRKGGMSVKFVLSSDNKYVQYRLMASTWSTTVADWQGVDAEPTAGSKNLVKSGGVYNAIKFISPEAEKILFGNRLLKIDGTYGISMNPCVKTTLYCNEVSLIYDKTGYTPGEGYCACWITDETGNTMIQGFNMDVIGFSGTIKIQKPEGADIWYLVWPIDGVLILNPSQYGGEISLLKEEFKQSNEIYYIEKIQQSGEEFAKYVGQDGKLYSVGDFGSNKFTVEPGLYNFKTTMPANSSVSLWAAYKGTSLVVKGSLTTVSREETFDLSDYDIDTIYISWTTATKADAILTRINTVVTDYAHKIKEEIPKISDDTVSNNSVYSSKKIEDSFVGLVAGKNIFNKDVVILDKYIKTTNGKTIDSQEGAWYNPEYIQVLPSQDYTCNKSGGVNYFIFYDENENIISSTHSSTFTTPNNAKFLRVTGFAQSQLSTLQIEKGNTTTAYEPYQLIIPQSIIQATLKDVIFVDLKIVDKRGTYGFTSINTAVASVQDGGVVLVMPGEYEEAVFCQNKEVNIIGFSRDECILYNTLGDYYNAPLYQSAGSLRNMTVWSKWDSNKDYSEIEHMSYAIHIDNYGDNKKYSIENCHLISDFSNTLGCGAKPNHCLTVKDCFVEHTNAYKEAFPSASTGGSNCMNMHGGGNESIILINNIFISKTTDLGFAFGEGNTDVFKLLCVNNAIKTVYGLVSSHFDINSRSYGNLNTSLNYQ